MKTCAIVTGAAGGIGKEFVKRLSGEEIDVIIAVGRNEEKLSLIEKEFGERIIPLKADLTTSEGISKVCGAMEGYNVRFLVNNAGNAYMGKFENMSSDKISSMVDLNCKACVLLAHAAIPHMNEGAVIYNISSASSFQPNPYLTLYSASKVFLKNFSRALNMELRDRKILSIAVCPGWVDTDMLKGAGKGSKRKLPGMVTAEKVVKRAFKDAKRKRDMSLSSLLYMYFRLYSKIVPTRIVMSQWLFGIRKVTH